MRRADYSNNPKLTDFQRGAGAGTYVIYNSIEAQIRKLRTITDEVMLCKLIPNHSDRQSTGGYMWVKREEIQPLPKETSSAGETEGAQAQ